MRILVLNAGSSSQKCALYDLADALPEDPAAAVWEAYMDWSQEGDTANLRVKTPAGETSGEAAKPRSRTEALQNILNTLWGSESDANAPADIDCVGHRVVHGGLDFTQSLPITAEVKAGIARLCDLAPLHNPVAVELIEAVEKLLPDTLQIAVFDTAFHRTLPPASYVYPGPYAWLEQGIRRYGFHGISHGYASRRTAKLLGRDPAHLRIVSCHLGSGGSLAAIKGGQSLDTTMGFTPLEGLMMGSRSGSVDPGILIYLLRKYATENLSTAEAADRLETVLNKESGLLGISGLSNDMRHILAGIDTGNDRAKLAYDLYLHRLRAQIGSMAAALEGLDALVFTNGIGSNSPKVRTDTCEGLRFLGMHLDPQKNAELDGDQDIATDDSPVRILVVFTREDWAIAEECFQIAAR